MEIPPFQSLDLRPILYAAPPGLTANTPISQGLAPLAKLCRRSAAAFLVLQSAL